MPWDAPIPLLAEPAPGRTVERRLAEIAGAIQEFAALRFDARAPIGADGDIVDAVAAGVNFLGEELAAAFNEIEQRVAERTAQLALATEDLARRSVRDDLTGLPNRAFLWEHLAHRLALADRRQTGLAVLFVDVDNFKAVNDTLGHAAGDRLLVDLAARLLAGTRATDTAARVGGDEFVVLLDEVASKGAALVVARHLARALRAPYDIGADRWVATTSIGVVTGPGAFRTADDMVAAADAAMYEAKRRGGGRCVFYDEDLRARQVAARRVGPSVERRSRG